MVIYAISCVLMIVIIGFITTPLLWIYGMWDAYKSAERINRDISERVGASAGPATH
jgi:hypothetical protein